MRDMKEIMEREEQKQRKAQEDLNKLLKKGHAKPVSRRDFVSHGLVAGGSYLLLPSIFEMVGKGNMAMAAECVTGGAGEPVPCIVIDVAGGMQTSTIIPAQGQGGTMGPNQLDLLSNYSTIAPVSTISSGDVDMSYGAPLRKADPFYSPFMGAASIAARSRTKVASFCGALQDDTQGNPIGVQSLIARLLGVGTNLLPILGNGNTGDNGNGGIGTSNAPSGGYSNPLLTLESAHRALHVSSLNVVNEAVNVGSMLKGASNVPQRNALMRSLSKLSGTQAKRAFGQHFLDTLKQLAECGVSAAKNVVDSNININPKNDPILSSVFGLNANTPENDENLRHASILKAVMDGYAPVGVMTRPGGDYHVNNLIGFNQVHSDLGRLTGRLLEAAHRMGRKLVVIWITDGAMGWTSGLPTSDRGEGSMLAMWHYSPTGVQMNFNQANYFTTGQAASLNDLIGGSPRRLALAIALNYAHISGSLEKFKQLVPDNEFPHSEIQRYLAFKA